MGLLKKVSHRRRTAPPRPAVWRPLGTERRCGWFWLTLRLIALPTAGVSDGGGDRRDVEHVMEMCDKVRAPPGVIMRSTPHRVVQVAFTASARSVCSV